MPKARMELVLTPDQELELVARMYRADVRASAGLPSDWSAASPEMKQWYIRLAKRLAGEPNETVQ